MALRTDRIGQSWLFPPSITDFISEDHICNLVVAVVNSLSIWNVEKKYRHQPGHPAYPRRMLLRLMVQAAIDGVFSSRKIDRLAQENVIYMYLAGNAKPDFSTIWRIRDRWKETGVDKQVWDELQRQLNIKGYRVKKGVIQDASFIEADLGKKRCQQEKKARRQSEPIKYTEKQLQHIDKDGGFSVIHGQIHYGYKSHIKIDVGHHLIHDLEVTPANLHDGDVDLVEEGDQAVYRDKGYFGKQLTASGVTDKTMKRSVRGRKLNGGEQKRNKTIGRVRAPGERPFSVIKRVFKGDRTQVKTLERIRVKEMFKCFAYDLYQLVTLDRKPLAVAM